MRKLDLNSNVILGKSGKEYKVLRSLPVARYVHFEKMQHHVGFGLDVQAMFSTLGTVYDLLNKQKFADAAVTVHNLMNGVARNVDKRLHPSLLLCTLFIVSDDEDLSFWDEESQAAKIEDFSDIDSADFFLLAANVVSGFIEIYQEVLANISKAEGAKKGKTK